MSTANQEFEQVINAPRSQVYHAFTNATVLREWCCDIATVDPKTGGRLYMAWNAGFYTAGEYVSLKEDEQVVFTWLGRGEPASSKVEINLKEHNGGTLLHLTHSEIGEGPEWEGARVEFKKGWTNGLENLASLLETGEDMRFVMRPMLGITINDFNEEIANQLGVPVTKGIRIDDTLENMGAQAAGLQNNDVIIGMNGMDVEDFASLNISLTGLKAGDSCDVVFYRGPEKKTVNMELSKRPLPEIPESPVELSHALEKQYLESEKQLNDFFDSITDEEASYKINQDEWSVKEVLAHLIQGERFYQFYVTELVGSQERWSDGYGGNVPGFIEATTESYGSLDNMRAELKRSRQETVMLFAKLPANFVEQKGTYWRLSYGALEGAFHDLAHLDQMQRSVESARNQ